MAKFGVFFTKAIYFQAPSRVSTVPVSDDWSWLGDVTAVNIDNRARTQAPADCTGRVAV